MMLLILCFLSQLINEFNVINGFSLTNDSLIKHVRFSRQTKNDDTSFMEDEYEEVVVENSGPEINILPMWFNASSKWGKMCPSIMRVPNQGKCKSGWAFSIASVITDRRCIKSFGKSPLPMSSWYLLTCCPNCCGCAGGNVLNGWKFARDTGLFTGSMLTGGNTNYQPEDGCQPHQIKPLKSKESRTKSSTQVLQTPVCENKCTNPNYIPKADRPIKYKIESFKFYSRHQPKEVMKELMTNGPIQVSFTLYEDFREYGYEPKCVKANKLDCCPIYVRLWGKNEGDHSAKLIGWGTDPGKLKYWILINSFGKNWGCDGLFKVPRDERDNMNFGYAIVAPTVDSKGPVFSIPISLLHLALVSLFCVN